MSQKYANSGKELQNRQRQICNSLLLPWDVLQWGLKLPKIPHSRSNTNTRKYAVFGPHNNNTLGQLKMWHFYTQIQVKTSWIRVKPCNLALIPNDVSLEGQLAGARKIQRQRGAFTRLVAEEQVACGNKNVGCVNEWILIWI